MAVAASIFDQLNIETVNTSTSVTFRCSYEMAVQVTSDALKIETVSIDGIDSATGHFDDGFKDDVH